MRFNKLVIASLFVSLVIIGCSKSKGPKGQDEVQVQKQFEHNYLKGPQAIQYSETTISFGNDNLVIEDLGWCDPIRDLEIQNNLGCEKVYDYSKLTWKNKEYYVYRSALNTDRTFRKYPLEKIEVSSDFKSSKVSDKLWLNAKPLIEKAKKYKNFLSFDLNQWRNSLRIEHSLFTKRCRGSKVWNQIHQYIPVKQGNRLIDAHEIFYLDNFLADTTTLIEFDLYKSSIVSLPITSMLSRKETIFSEQEFLSRNDTREVRLEKELFLYNKAKLRDAIKPYKPNYVRYFSEICSNIYGKYLISSSNHNPEPKKYSYYGYFPPYNPKLDESSSKKLDVILQNHGEFNLLLGDEEYNYPYETEILSEQEILSRIPSVENLTGQDLDLLKKNNFPIQNNQEFLDE